MFSSNVPMMQLHSEPFRVWWCKASMTLHSVTLFCKLIKMSCVTTSYTKWSPLKEIWAKWEQRMSVVEPLAFHSHGHVNRSEQPQCGAPAARHLEIQRENDLLIVVLTSICRICYTSVEGQYFSDDLSFSLWTRVKVKIMPSSLLITIKRELHVERWGRQ